MQSAQSWVAKYWVVISVIMIGITTLISGIFGYFAFEIFDGFFITIYGVFVFGLALAETNYAIKNHIRITRITRKPTIDRLIRNFPEHESELRKAYESFVRYDDFLLQIRQILGLADPGPIVLTSESESEKEKDWSWLQKEVAVLSDEKQIDLTSAIVAPTFKLPWIETLRIIRTVYDQTYPADLFFLDVNSDVLPDYNGLTAYSYSWYKPPDFSLVKNRKAEVVRYHTWLKMMAEAELSNPRYSAHSTEYIILVQPIPGKREAMYQGFQAAIDAQVDIIINIDGDTNLHRDNVLMLLRIFAADPEHKVALITGDVRVENRGKGPHCGGKFLTELTAQRYFEAFNKERGAQSYFGQVLCVSGPNFAIRREVLEQIVEEWVAQTFLGQKCTYGDDRHITTLVILKKLGKVLFVPDAIVWTDCPDNFRDFVEQQERWNKSGYRENFLIIPVFTDLAILVQIKTLHLSYFPFIIVGIIFGLLFRAGIVAANEGIVAALDVIWPYLLVIWIANFMKSSLYGMFLNRDWKFILSSFYPIIWFRYLLRLKFVAITQLKDTSWGTK